MVYLMCTISDISERDFCSLIYFINAITMWSEKLKYSAEKVNSLPLTQAHILRPFCSWSKQTTNFCGFGWQFLCLLVNKNNSVFFLLKCIGCYKIDCSVLDFHLWKSLHNGRFLDSLFFLDSKSSSKSLQVCWKALALSWFCSFFLF